MARILVLTGHPRKESLCGSLADRYAAGAVAAGHTVRRIALADLPMDLVAPSYRSPRSEEPAWVRELQEAIQWAEHLVVTAPLWWGDVPAALNHLFERTLLPGFAFSYRTDGRGWDKLLNGRSVRTILTMDTPPIVFRWFWGWPLIRRLRRQVFSFCGMAPNPVTLFGPVRTSTAQTRESWLAAAEALGRNAA